MATSASGLRIKFFEWVFGDHRGHLCIAYALSSKKDFKHAFFQWPAQKNSMEAFVNQVSRGHNVWFCTSLLRETKRKKEFAIAGNLVWADLDELDPDAIEPPPSCVVESSPGRFQAYWRMDKTVIPKAQEEYCRKLAYKYEADLSGWDLTQLLRVPYTQNYKYEEHPIVEIVRVDEELVPHHLFDEMYVDSQPSEVIEDKPFPNVLELPSPENIMYRYKFEPMFHELYEVEPLEGDDWSKRLWRLINICLEAEMQLEEVFVIAQTAKCNKYERDGRPPSHLWKEILKADEVQRVKAYKLQGREYSLEMPKLVDDVATNPFVDQYKEWALEVTDAPAVYHELVAAILLSAILAPNIELELTWGSLTPDIWGLILGGSTLTRKTTAMGMGRGILNELDSEIILANDASPEGLLAGLSVRANRVSMFYRDEVAGFFKDTRDKTYMQSLPEILTQLYDSPHQMIRRLRKETFTIVEPHFIFFGGGIRDNVYSYVEERHITSGFIPRFLVVSGTTTADQRKRTGPRVPGSREKRDKIISTLADLREKFSASPEIKTPGGATISLPTRISAVPTQAAWNRLWDCEYKLELAGEQSDIKDLALPTFTRLYGSLMKLAMLFAATKYDPDENHTMPINELEVIEAANYVQQWGHHSVNLVVNAGKAEIERITEKVMETVRIEPGVFKTDLFRKFHLRTKAGDEIMSTLIERGLIYFRKEGKGFKVFPTVEGAI